MHNFYKYKYIKKMNYHLKIKTLFYLWVLLGYAHWFHDGIFTGPWNPMHQGISTYRLSFIRKSKAHLILRIRSSLDHLNLGYYPMIKYSLFFIFFNQNCDFWLPKEYHTWFRMARWLSNVVWLKNNFLLLRLLMRPLTRHFIVAWLS